MTGIFAKDKIIAAKARRFCLMKRLAPGGSAGTVGVQKPAGRKRDPMKQSAHQKWERIKQIRAFARLTQLREESSVSKFFKRILNQMFIVLVLLFAQIALLVAGILQIRGYYFWSSLLHILSVVVVLHLIVNHQNPTYKLAWIVPILLFPLFGGLFYLIVQAQKLTNQYKKRAKQVRDASAPYLAQPPEVVQAIEHDEPAQADIAGYLHRLGGYPVSGRTATAYLSTGEEKWAAMLDELQKAERYIFLEYFIIKEGAMWERVLEILKQKATQGVDVRVLYDGVGSGSVLPYKYFRKLRSFGIQSRVFSPFVPFLSVLQNNRDHRKICVVDGVSAICGGVNLADEYINVEERFGHWKDSAVLLRGEAAYTFAVMFLQMWHLSGAETPDYDAFRPVPQAGAAFEPDGFVAPYGDSPLDDEPVSASVYLDVINSATRYLYITTPYLVLDEELSCALMFASKRGVDVRLIVPGIPDKWYVYSVTTSHFEPLTRAGVRIYTYTPGFIHSKTFVADDALAVVGSVNLDYRSLYLHYECAVWMCRTAAVPQVRDDFCEMLPHCRLVTLEDCRQVGAAKRLLRAVLRLFAPLM